MSQKHSHYHKDVSHLKSIDIYRLLELFDVTDQAIGHAVKKLICAGKRGSKSFEQDVREAVDTLNRRLQMIAEDDNRPPKASALHPLDGLPTVKDPLPMPRVQGAKPGDCLSCGEFGGHYGLPCPKAVPVAHFGGLGTAPPTQPSQLAPVPQGPDYDGH